MSAGVLLGVLPFSSAQGSLIGAGLAALLLRRPAKPERWMGREVSPAMRSLMVAIPLLAVTAVVAHDDRSASGISDRRGWAKSRERR